jgi:hypothetical protein
MNPFVSQSSSYGRTGWSYGQNGYYPYAPHNQQSLSVQTTLDTSISNSQSPTAVSPGFTLSPQSNISPGQAGSTGSSTSGSPVENPISTFYNTFSPRQNSQPRIGAQFAGAWNFPNAASTGSNNDLYGAIASSNDPNFLSVPSGPSSYPPPSINTIQTRPVAQESIPQEVRNIMRKYVLVKFTSQG